MENEISKKLQEIEKRYKKMKQLFTGFVSVVLIAIVCLGFTKSNHVNLIRTKGIIIEDENGKDRILIGAPIPHSVDRVRTDINLVRKYFASDIYPKDPDKYMEWYKKYRHSAFGIVFMNDKGIDIMQLGEKLSDPNVGRRIFLPTGILLNNNKGMEVGGFGTHTFEDGRSGVALGLDDPGDGREAFHAAVLSDGTRALIIQDSNGKLVLGFGKPKSDLFKNKDSLQFVGIKYFDKKDNLLWEQKVNKTE
ncbi:hypothetical protein CRN76_06860 [Chryseobacterium indologenes]|uniref:hypothetical protein n=1 Tax=Chryseobacterium indologenes TaxID=253 RepID=UPI000BFCE0C1|nr:hypothetical protein [Chryseobacterium indologenes]ATN05143.1 hypothetical protein CRN76_06860 [Chryseobacterium indologenes]AYY86104.1 hypothetical protein EGX91_16890 [Chryseobacterium indologenes]QIX83004.1 hypothetical protein FOB56_17925 [Chryseobacterium indologenes]UDQ52680.1 hypothetical protein LJF28_14700 [Chryseobacterium indologenes]